MRRRRRRRSPQRQRGRTASSAADLRLLGVVVALLLLSSVAPVPSAEAWSPSAASSSSAATVKTARRYWLRKAFGPLPSSPSVAVFSSGADLSEGVASASSSSGEGEGDVIAEEILRAMLRSDDRTPVVLDGYVGKRRAIGRSLAFLDVHVSSVAVGDETGAPAAVAHAAAAADEDEGDSAPPPSVQALLRREFWEEKEEGAASSAYTAATSSSSIESSPSFDVYHKILQPGVRVRLVGRAGPSRNPGEAVLFVTSATYAGPNSNPQHLRNVLRYARDDEDAPGFKIEEAAAALGMKGEELEERLARTLQGKSGGPAETSCGELAREILDAFSRNEKEDGVRRRRPLLDPNKIMGQTGAGKRAILPPAPRRFDSPPEWVVAEEKDEGYNDFDQSVSDFDESVSWRANPLSVRAVLDAGADQHGERKMGEKEESVERRTTATMPVTISAWVQNRRRYGNSVTVLEMVDDFSAVASLRGSSDSDSDSASDSSSGEGVREGKAIKERKKQDEEEHEEDMRARAEQVRDLWKGRIYSVLHPEITRAMAPPDGSGESREQNSTALTNAAADTYGNVLGPGARALLRGYVVLSKDIRSDDESGGTATLWVTSAYLLRSSWRPSSVRTVLDLLHSGKMDVEEAAGALELPGGYGQAEDIARGGKDSAMDATERQWLAAEVSRELQRGGELSRIGVVSEEMRSAMELCRKDRERFPLKRGMEPPSEEGDVDLSAAGDPLRTSSSGSRWQRAKRPQLRWMVKQIEEVVTSHPSYGLRPLNVVDVGGGRGHLANLIAEVLGPDVAAVRVVDVCQSAVRNGAMRARRRGLGNVRYEADDASAADMKGAAVVVALHACGALSDVALGHAVAEGAAFVVCPCCYRSNPQLCVRMPLALASSFASSGSDDDVGSPAPLGGERLGTVAEWLDVDPNVLEALKSAAEIQGDITTSELAMHSICAMRARTAERRHNDARTDAAALARSERQLSVEIRTFPIGFSTRNLCLVGKIS